MKFQKLDSFEKHFAESFPENLSAMYCIVCPKESERKMILGSLAKRLEKRSALKKCLSVKEAVEHLNSSSFFSPKMCALLDGVDKSEIDSITQYLKAPNPQGCFLLGLASSQEGAKLYKEGKKEMVLLDLSKEKPWEEKERMKQWVVQTLLAEAKQIAPDALEALFATVLSDRLFLQQELDKLLCFVGERKQITRSDIETICLSSVEANSFQIAQKLAFGKLESIPQIKDLSFLLPLIGLLRNQLEMGLKMATCIQRGESKGEIAKRFPQLWPKVVQQALEAAVKRRSPFFQRGLLALFDLEFGVKTSRGRPDILFTQFCARMEF